MSETTKPTNTPPKTITVTANGAEREIKMTYGLLNELVSMVGDIEEIAKFYVDETLRNKALVSVLSERSNTGKITAKADMEEIDIEIEDIDQLLSWVAAHVTGFFIRSLTNLADKMKDFPTEHLTLQALESTPQSPGSAP